MKTEDFIQQLDYIQDLMQKANYKEALILIEKLKELDKSDDFDYNLTHRLYQLDSNTRSLFNQEIILKTITHLSIKTKTISFHELNQKIKEMNNLVLSAEILRREVELLILRNQLVCKIDNDFIVLNSS